MLAALMLVFTLVFTNFFDAMGTMTGLSKEAGLADEKGDFPRIKSALIVEGVAPSPAATLRVVEHRLHRVRRRHRRGGPHRARERRHGSAVPRRDVLHAARSIVPIEVAAAALVIVGALMMSQIKYIDFSEFSVLLPVFLAITVMPLTYSIANGIGAGFISLGHHRLALGQGEGDQPPAVDRCGRLPGLLRPRPRRGDARRLSVADEVDPREWSTALGRPPEQGVPVRSPMTVGGWRPVGGGGWVAAGAGAGGLLSPGSHGNHLNRRHPEPHPGMPPPETGAATEPAARVARRRPADEGGTSTRRG